MIWLHKLHDLASSGLWEQLASESLDVVESACLFAVVVSDKSSVRSNSGIGESVLWFEISWSLSSNGVYSSSFSAMRGGRWGDGRSSMPVDDSWNRGG